VGKYVERGSEPPRYGPRKPRSRRLEPYERYLRQRVAAYPGLTGKVVLDLQTVLRCQRRWQEILYEAHIERTPAENPDPRSAGRLIEEPLDLGNLLRRK
jgi:hypothetical protein